MVDMDTLFAVLADQFAQQSDLELVAVVLAVAYLVLAIRQNIWCWVCAGISTAIFVILFARANLYMESALNVFYFGMALYGWNAWRNGAGDDRDLKISVWRWSIHCYAIVAIAVLSLATGFLLEQLTDAKFPYVDSMTTYSAIWATFLVARKVLENWWYWLVIDLASIFIFWSRDLELTSLLFAVYVILIPIGLLAWTRAYRVDHPVAESV